MLTQLDMHRCADNTHAHAHLLIFCLPLYYRAVRTARFGGLTSGVGGYSEKLVELGLQQQALANAVSVETVC